MEGMVIYKEITMRVFKIHCPNFQRLIQTDTGRKRIVTPENLGKT